MDRFYDAEVMFRTMAETSPDLGRVELVNFLLRRKRFGQAIAIVESDIDPATNGEIVAQLNVSAAHAALESRSADPLPFIEAALRRSPGNGSAISLMEQLLTQRGDTAGLDRLHRDELLAPCVRPEDFARRSFRFLALNRVEEARDAADLGLTVFPSYPELRFNTGLASLRLGDESRAATEFGRVDESSTKVFSQAMQMRAALLLKSGDPDAALESLERWISAEPENVDAVIQSAQMLAGTAARASGRVILERHLDLDRRVALELAGMLMQDGDLAGAGRVAEKALQ
jgi:tetratricopeptide (TPR) repeat protein